MKKYLIILVIALFAFAGQSQSKKQGPHGGQLNSAKYYFVELVECYEYLEIYVYEADMSPLRNYGFSGFVDFYFPDNTCLTSNLYPYGVNAFTAEVTRQCFTSCQVYLRQIGIMVQVSFTDMGASNEDCKKPAGAPISQ